jgi:probable HAF family extracellular repeat protein
MLHRHSINNDGQVVGTFERPDGGDRPFVYYPEGRFKDLTTVPGGTIYSLRPSHRH